MVDRLKTALRRPNFNMSIKEDRKKVNLTEKSYSQRQMP